LLGKSIFRETILSPIVFRKKVLTALRTLISNDRLTEITNDSKSLLQELLEMMSDLSYYYSDFEPLFLEDTKVYYKSEGAKQFNLLSPPYYINYAQKCLNDESSSRKSYLASDTKKKSGEVIVKQLILTHTQKLINMGFDAMMEADMTEPLASLYAMLRPYSELTLLRTAFEKYVKSEGEKMIKYPDEDPTMIQSLIDFKGSLDNILGTCFKGDVNFSNSLKESFEYFINTRGNKPAELLSKFIDGKIKPSSKQAGDSSDENMTLLNNSLDLFRFIHAKDAFEAYYKRALSKRLLLNRSISIDLEGEILEKLKAECGEDYTKNLESMINDMRISSEMSIVFTDQNKAIVKYPMTINVISQEVWPTYINTNLTLPDNMNKILDKYTEFYSKRFNGRNLKWQKNSSSCVLRGNFPRGIVNIYTSLVHCVVLLHFNDTTTINIEDLQSGTGLDREELERALQSLTTGKTCVLKKLTGSQFEYNAGFKSQSSNIRIKLQAAEQSVTEERDVEINIAKDRQLQVDAAIVRIMKKGKTMAHPDLMSEVFKEFKFPIEANDIKKRIESLIDKGYLKRDPNDSSQYNYLS
ncbi:Cullin-domain-containing protein, partial [Backusella circina FSU 941]